MILVACINWSLNLEIAAMDYVVSALINSVIVVHTIKDYFQVPRPAWVLDRDLSVTHIMSSSFSFPSGHTMMVSFGSAFLLFQDPSHWYIWASLWFASCLIMGSSRIILGVHWFQDVMFSVVTGPLIACFCIF